VHAWLLYLLSLLEVGNKLSLSMGKAAPNTVSPDRQSIAKLSIGIYTAS